MESYRQLDDRLVRGEAFQTDQSLGHVTNAAMDSSGQTEELCEGGTSTGQDTSKTVEHYRKHRRDSSYGPLELPWSQNEKVSTGGEQCVEDVMNELLERCVFWIVLNCGFSSCPAACNAMLSDWLAHLIQQLGRTAKNFALLRGCSTTTYIDMKNAILSPSAVLHKKDTHGVPSTIVTGMVSSGVSRVVVEAAKRLFQSDAQLIVRPLPIEGPGLDDMCKSQLMKYNDSWLYRSLMSVRDQGDGPGMQHIVSERKPVPEMPRHVHPHMPMLPSDYTYQRTSVEWGNRDIKGGAEGTSQSTEKRVLQRNILQRSNIQRITMQEQLPLLHQPPFEKLMISRTGDVRCDVGCDSGEKSDSADANGTSTGGRNQDGDEELLDEIFDFQVPEKPDGVNLYVRSNTNR